MRQRAYHTLILPDGSTHRLVIVETDDNDVFTGFRPIRTEEPFVEWIGGTLDLRYQ